VPSFLEKKIVVELKFAIAKVTADQRHSACLSVERMCDRWAADE